MITQADAMKAVDSMELMAYFGTLSAGARVLIAEELMAMVNWPADRVLKNAHGEVIPYVDPQARLNRLLAMLRSVVEWPGMANIRGLYCKMYKPADGFDVSTCSIPGFTDDECESGSDLLSLSRGQDQTQYLPQPGDEPIGEELPRQIAAAAKRLTAGEDGA